MLLTGIFETVPQFFEKSGQEARALVLKHAGNDLWFMVERQGIEIADRTKATRFGVGRAVDHPPDAGIDNRARTHRARLQRHIEVAPM